MLTELEGDVLGFVWKLGPVTTYRIRKVFADSPSSRWRASAGSIYPVVERLLERGLVVARRELRGRRSSSSLSPTPRGERALREWVRPADPGELVGSTHDPLRTRLHFLSLLPADERRALLERLVELLEAEVRLYGRPDHPAWSEGDPWDDVVRRGAREMQRARLRWIRWILAREPLARPGAATRRRRAEPRR